MREEDLDWHVYHIIAMKGPIAMDELAEISRQPGDAIRDSIARLEQKCLIDHAETGVRVLSVEESITRCRVMHCKDNRIFFENGVIKVRPESERDSQ